MTPEECKEETQKHIFEVAKLLQKMATQLLMRGLLHDKTKLSSPELELFTEYTPKLKTVEFGSEKYKEFLKELKVALDHHYAKNSHHPEHHGDAGIKGMSLVDLMEMLCDWKDSSKRMKNGDIMKSIEQQQERFGYSDELKQIFKNTVAREFDVLPCNACGGDGKQVGFHDVEEYYNK